MNDADHAAMARQFPFLAGDDDATRLVRATDWAATPLGPIDGWPAPLRTMLGMMLHSRNPMLLYWGPRLIHFFNTAFIPSLDARQFPDSMGQPGDEAWSDIWPVIGPKLQNILDGGGATWDEDQLIPGLRHGRIVDVYWNYSFTPVLLESGQPGGVLVVATETTARMVAARRQVALHRVSDALARLPLLDGDLFADAFRALAPTRVDAPCVAYLRWADPAQAPLVMGRFPAADEGQWPEDQLTRALQGQPEHFDSLARGEAVYLSGVLAWASPDHSEPVTDVLLLPLHHAGETEPQCVAFGLNPRVPMGEGYRRFFQSMTDELSSAIQRGESARARQRAFEERDNLLRQAPLAIAIMMGPELVFTLVNPMYCRVTGRTEDALIGRSYVQAFPELADTALPGILKNVYLTGERYASPETPIALDFGGGQLEERYFEFNLEPMRDLQQQVTGLMAVAIDVTPRVQARASIERSHAERQLLLERAQSAGRAKDEFLAMLGHELRNPLAPIVSALHVMAARQDSSTAREQAVIRRQVDHMVRLVDDLMDVSRIARGRVRLQPTLARPAVLAMRALEMTQPLIDSRGHQVSVSLPERPVLWWGDSDRLVQVVSNLLTNAARYTPHGGHIHLTVRREDDTVVIEVADNGSGIEPEVLPHIFETFTQGQPQGIARTAGGLGLGLALVKNLVALHDGQVQAFSEGPGRGSRFVVRLPLHEQPQDMPADVPSGLQAAEGTRRILVVDDNRDGAELLAELLALHGHQVRIAHDGPEALAVAELLRPEVALLDIGLPGMDGYELARRLRTRLGEGCVLLALSGYGQAEDRDRALAAGFAQHLVKPVDPAQLLELLAKTR